MATKKVKDDSKTVSKKNSTAIKTKETVEKEKKVKKVTKTAESGKKVTSKKDASPKKTGSKNVSSKRTSSKSDSPKRTSSKSVSKKSEAVRKNVSKSQKDVAVKKVSKKTSTKSKTGNKVVASKTDKKSTSSKVAKVKETEKWSAKPMLAEYYDLPYRYNETVVKILAQTPTTLFVYWDISDNDRSSLINTHGENFFYETKPILIIHNITKNYSFELEINDFANSWYIRTQEPNCDYVIELGRKAINKPEEYIYIDSSNKIVSPNDHILFEKANLGNVLFRNVKTNVLSSKDFGSLRFINDIDKLYGNLYDVYSRLYNDETLNKLENPSSGEFIRK